MQRERRNLKHSQTYTVKGFYSHFPHFAFATASKSGSRRKRSDEETTFMGEMLENFK
jgi:hypothetical protein